MKGQSNRSKSPVSLFERLCV